MYKMYIGSRLQHFIDNNTEYIDEVIKRGSPSRIPDNETRAIWVLNDKELYDYARSKDVLI